MEFEEDLVSNVYSNGFVLHIVVLLYSVVGEVHRHLRILLSKFPYYLG